MTYAFAHGTLACGVAFVMVLCGWHWRPRYSRYQTVYENTKPPIGPPPLKFRRSTRQGHLDATDVVSYLHWRDQRLRRTLADGTNALPMSVTDPTDAELLATVDAVTVTLPPLPMDQADAQGRIEYDVAWRIAMARAVLERWGGRAAAPNRETRP